uniref:Putative thiamine pyrophosphate enzyme n=1 Tax=viral metagenome TaxID=1070528 RepID=A0A6M3IU02_9ZZZZ
MKPLLVAGHGIRIAKAQDELIKVLELGIPVVTTFNGFDLVPSDHPNFVGRIGTVGTYGGNYALKNCDTLICVGTRNNIRQISYNWASFAPQANKIVCDIDIAEIRKPTIPVNNWHWGDAKSFLNNLLIWNFNINKDWLPSLKQYNNSHPIELTPPYKFIHELTTVLPNDAVVVCGNGTACVAMFQAGIVKKGQRIFWNSGTAAMGYDLPAAIGTCFANDKKEVYCITGDGSIQMNLQELQTIKHHQLPIKIFVLNNGGYRSLEMTQENYFKGDYIGCNKQSGISFPDFKKVADTFDLKYYNGYKELEQMIYYPFSLLCEVHIGNSYIINPKFTNSL